MIINDIFVRNTYYFKSAGDGYDFALILGPFRSDERCETILTHTNSSGCLNLRESYDICTGLTLDLIHFEEYCEWFWGFLTTFNSGFIGG